MRKTDVLVIGGSAGGILTATTCKKVYKDKEVVLVRKTNTVMVPCGIPYIFGTLNETGKNRIPDTIITNPGCELIISEAVKLDSEAHLVTLSNGDSIQYDKLVIATGSNPIIPKFIPGYELGNIFAIYKSEDYLADLLLKIAPMTNIAVVGGGFIGVEFAEQLRILGKNITLIEMQDQCLQQAFDSEICTVAEEELKTNGIVVKTGVKVAKFNGEVKVSSIELSNGETLQTDGVILGMGVVPNSSLAKEAGLKLDQRNAIIVDEYMRTSAKDVFAVGDCADKKRFFTGKSMPVLLASTAALEAKVAAANLFGLRYIRENRGTISAFSTKIFKKTFASAGIGERRALEEGFEIVIGKFATMDKHPGSLPGSTKIELKLIFVKTSGVLIGAQIIGGESIGEMINILSLAIQKGLTANELNTFQTATHPLVTASPIAYPINAAALDALTK
jgi:NADPH-dependent 2,4-dienoyl-CoA reductase/sulfur reductase-like enzyme